MRKAFTLIEIVAAVALLGVVTAMIVATYSAVSRGWEVSTEYMDKIQRMDYAINQVVTALRSMYYSHDGKQRYEYGFVLSDNGAGEDPDSSDTIEWSKTGSSIVGNTSAVADTVHRVRVMVLEEGDSDYGEKIEKTGLYARLCPDSVLRPKDDEVDYSFANMDMYRPVLIADGIVGMNCRVLKNADARDAENDRSKFDDTWDTSNSVPYKVELTFRIADPEGRAYRSNTAPAVRIVRIPIFEQSLDGATTPAAEKEDARRGGGPLRGGARGGGVRGGGMR